MKKTEIKNILLEAFGEISAIFMSQDIKGTKIVMPSEELIRIAEETAKKITDNPTPQE